MKRPNATQISSAALPVFIIDRLVAKRPFKPRVDVIFDPYTRLILGFRLTDDEGHQIG